MSCDRRCYDEKSPWFKYDDCATCEGADDGHEPGTRRRPTMEPNELKPCPFCGNKDIEIEREGTNRQSCVIACGYCGARMESNEIGHGDAWNTRAENKGGL